MRIVRCLIFEQEPSEVKFKDVEVGSVFEFTTKPDTKYITSLYIKISEDNKLFNAVNISLNTLVKFAPHILVILHKAVRD